MRPAQSRLWIALQADFRVCLGLLLTFWASTATGQEEPEVQSLRERLTEREDETRVEDPYTLDLLGRPLSLSGQFEVALETMSRIALGDGEERGEQLRLDQELELEAFYNFSRTLSFFAQIRPSWEEDLHSGTPEGVSDFFVERGEFWLFARRIAGSGFSLDLGRLNFEDDRRWWWDEELDALRIIYEGEDFELALAAGQELIPARSDRSFVEPEHEKVFRLIAELSWDWRPEHSIQFFGLYHDDHSRSGRRGEILRRGREDESDAELLWMGGRAAGGVELRERGTLGYWFDAGGVVGRERLILAEQLPRERLEVTDVSNQKVSGAGFDIGATWLLPAPAEPRVTLGYALGSGGFRQTGLHANEPGFGGVQSFKGYGRLLDPELSNLSILTVGLGCSLLKSSSLDLVFHDYRLLESAESLRDARIDSTLTGNDGGLGQGLDLVLAIEELREIQLEVSASAFRAGPAFGAGKGEWVFASFLALRIAF